MTTTAEAVSAPPIPLRLDIGGDVPRDGWTIVDRKVGKEAYPLDYPDESADEIEASHILEHFKIAEKVNVLREWVRVLKPGGLIRIAVPDLEKTARMWLAGELPRHLDIERIIYGGQVDANDHHGCGFHFAELASMMNKAGLIGVQRWAGRTDSSSSYPFSLNLEGRKMPDEAFIERTARSIVGVMSKPRLSWTENTDAMHAAIHRLGIAVTTGTSAYVMQTFETTMSRHADEGLHKYILTIDYDTVFSPGDVLQLAMFMEMHTEIDALAPMQVKRGGTAWLIGHAMKRDDMLADVVEPKSAHFGLTMFRADRLRDLPPPWMMPVPGPDGRWGDGHQDEDIRFWHHFREHGRRVFLCPRVVVGHLEVVVAWPDRRTLKPMYQHVDQYQDDGPPPQTFG